MQLIDSSANGRKFPLGMESALMNKLRPQSLQWMTNVPALHEGKTDDGYFEYLLYTEHQGKSMTMIFPSRREWPSSQLAGLSSWLVVI